MIQRLLYHVSCLIAGKYGQAQRYFCAWHVRRVWQKQTCIKIKDVVVWAKVLKNMGRIMHDIVQPDGKTPLDFAKEELQKLMEMILDVQTYWSYVISKWVPKCEMWVMGNQNLPYASHDTNAAIESYHANLKAILRVTKSRLCGRWVAWCRHQLLGDVLLHYWYQSLRKNWGFVPNKKQEQFVINIVLHARDIPNSCLTFPKDNGGYVIVIFWKHEYVNYKAYNLEFEWVYCECL
jgi:hypothetical protein